VHQGVSWCLEFTLGMRIVKVIEYLTRGVSHFGLAIYIKKYLKAKEE
jgi:hypothetical protein